MNKLTYVHLKNTLNSIMELERQGNVLTLYVDIQLLTGMKFLHVSL